MLKEGYGFQTRVLVWPRLDLVHFLIGTRTTIEDERF